MGHCQHIRAAPQSRPVRASRKKSTLCVAASLVDFLFLFVSETVMNQPEDKIQAITALSLTEKIEVQGTTVPFTNILASFENHKPSPTSYPYPICPLSIPVQASSMGLFMVWHPKKPRLQRSCSEIRRHTSYYCRLLSKTIRIGRHLMFSISAALEHRVPAITKITIFIAWTPLATRRHCVP